jgi:hypothetical protein
MKGTKLVGAGLLALLALMLAIPASGASAAKLLELKSGGTVVPVGSAVSASMELEGCGMFSNGKLGANDAAKITATGTSTSEVECPEGVSASGLIKETQLASSGKVKLVGAITISLPGPCVYAFTKFKSTFEVPGFIFFKGTSVGKLNKALSSKSCAKTTSQIFRADVTNEPFGEPFEDALKS